MTYPYHGVCIFYIPVTTSFTRALQTTCLQDGISTAIKQALNFFVAVDLSRYAIKSLIILAVARANVNTP
jgi:hypothetical protein